MALSKKGTALAFGIGAGGMTAPTVTGIDAVQSAEASSELTVNASARDAGGETVAHVYGDEKTTLRAEGFAAAATLPSMGTPLTVAGKSGVVMRSTITASNGDFVKISVEGEKFAGVTY
jgi:hypothetical protein